MSKYSVILDNACWLGPYGTAYAYRVVRVHGKDRYAHRAVWQEVNGPIPRGKVIRHMCGNKGCANPKHLELGTHKDNAADRERAKG